MKHKKHIIYFIMVLFAGCIFRMGKVPPWKNNITLNEMLGYEKKQKLLIINCDDIGIHPALTDGAVRVMKSGLVKSASMIVNDRNDKELKRIAKIAKKNPQWGFGIHLSLNDEYQETFPWGPVASKKECPTLYNEKGLAWKTREEAQVKVDPKDAEKEWEAQVLKAKSFGIHLTHIDSHMGTYFFKSKYPGSGQGWFCPVVRETRRERFSHMKGVVDAEPNQEALGTNTQRPDKAHYRHCSHRSHDHRDHCPKHSHCGAWDSSDP